MLIKTLAYASGRHYVSSKQQARNKLLAYSASKPTWFYLIDLVQYSLLSYRGTTIKFLRELLAGTKKVGNNENHQLLMLKVSEIVSIEIPDYPEINTNSLAEMFQNEELMNSYLPTLTNKQQHEKKIFWGILCTLREE